MNKNLVNPRFLALTGMILVAAFTRLIPHYPNFTAIGAMALFGGTYFTNKKLAFIVPFVAMLLTDLILGFHATIWAVYLGFAIMVLIGFGLRGRVKTINVLTAGVAASVLFFVITNFAFWTTGFMYPLNLAGLIESFAAGIPFFGYSVIGNLFYIAILFGSFELMQARYPRLAKVTAQI